MLRVGATPQVIENLLAGFLPRYRKRHPGVDVCLVEDGGARLPGRLERGDLHIAIMPAGEDRFSGRLLYPMHLLAVLPRRHRLSRRAVLEVAELAEEPLLRLAPGFASHGWFEAACQIAHIRPRVLLESVAPQTLIAIGAGRSRHCRGSLSGRGFRARNSRGRASCIAECRSVDGRSPPGIRRASWRPTACNLSRNWLAIARVVIRAANTFGARRRCPSQMLVSLETLSGCSHASARRVIVPRADIGRRGRQVSQSHQETSRQKLLAIDRISNPKRPRRHAITRSGASLGASAGRPRAVAPNGADHAGRRETRCCRGLQSTDARSTSH